MLSGFLLALLAGGLGAARALAPGWHLVHLLLARSRSVFLGSLGALTVLTGAGAILACASLATHLSGFRAADVALAPGFVGGVLLLLIQIAYIPNAIVWSICYTLGPDFVFGAQTASAPTGSDLGLLPLLPMLAALPTGAHSAVPAWTSAAMLSVPYLAGAFGGLLDRAGRPDTSRRTGPAVGVRQWHRRGRRDRPAGRVCRWSAGQRPVQRGWAVRLADRGGGRAGGWGGRRGDHGAGQLAADAPGTAPGRRGRGPR